MRNRRRLGVVIWLTVAGVLIFLGSLTAHAAMAKDDALQQTANRAQVLGLLLAIGVPLIDFAWRIRDRLANERGVADWAAELARVVADQEDRNRLNLLGSAHAADLEIGELDAEAELEPWFLPRASTERMRLETLADYYRGLGPHGRLVILGEPGSGKTVTAVQLIGRLLDADPEPRRIPVRFSLADWDPAQQVDAWFVDRLVRDYRIPPVQAEDLVRKRRILPVLDGLDEMDPGVEDGAPSRAIEVLRWLNDAYTVAGSVAGVIITCRSKRYAELAARGARLQQAREIELLPLEPQQIRDYLERVFASDRTTLAAWRPELDRLDDAAAGPIWAVLATPWRLTLAITRVRAGKTPRQVLRPHAGEAPASAAARIESELLEGYVESATKLASGGAAQRWNAGDTTSWLEEIARHLRRTSPETGDRFSAIDILPYRLFDGSVVTRRVHAAIAGGIMAAGCVVLALDGIGPTSEWITLTRAFFTHDSDVVVRLFQDVLPVVCLIGLPILAAWLASRTVPDPVPRRRRRADFRSRFRQNFGLASAGAVIAPIGLFFAAEMKDSLSWVSDPLPVAEAGADAVRVAVLFLLLATYVVARDRGHRLVRTLVLTGVVAATVWFLYTATVPDLPASTPAVTALAVAYLVVLPGAWCLALIWMARAILSLRDSVVDRLRLTGRDRATALAAAIAVPALLVWLFLVLGEGLASGRGRYAGLSGLWFDPATAVALGISAGLLAAVITAFRRRLGGTVVVGFVTGLCIGFAGGLDLDLDVPAGEMYFFAFFLVEVLVGAAAAAALMALLLRDPVPLGAERRQPPVALRDDLAASAVTAAAIAIPVLLAFLVGGGTAVGIPLVGPWGAAAIALAAALAFGPLGRRAWFRYRVGAALAAAAGRLPWRLNAFLDWAVDARLLRVNGSAYQFRHLELQHWLMRRGEAPADEAVGEPVAG